jgi:biopolymer transport protein ExbD
MSGSVSSELKADPNLVPILDMVFQLITFFMLLFNAKNVELAEGVNLPVLGSARPTKGPLDEHVIVFNFKINKDTGALERWVLGRKVPVDPAIGPDDPDPALENFVAGEARASMLAARMTDEDITVDKGLPDTVVIRADGRVRFGPIQRVVKAYQDKGYRKFAFKADWEAKTKPKPS